MQEFFSKPHREIQSWFDGQRVADKLFERRVSDALAVYQSEFIKQSMFFFIASSIDECIDCSIKCGPPGFVEVIDDKTICWPDYDGNLMFRTLGNISSNPNVSLLFVNFQNPSEVNSPGMIGKIRLNGKANLCEPTSNMLKLGVKLSVKFNIEFVIPNCPRYLPDLSLVRQSKFNPKEGELPPTPEWKTRDYIRDILPK